MRQQSRSIGFSRLEFRELWPVFRICGSDGLIDATMWGSGVIADGSVITSCAISWSSDFPI